MDMIRLKKTTIDDILKTAASPETPVAVLKEILLTHFHSHYDEKIYRYAIGNIEARQLQFSDEDIWDIFVRNEDYHILHFLLRHSRDTRFLVHFFCRKYEPAFQATLYKKCKFRLKNRCAQIDEALRIQIETHADHPEQIDFLIYLAESTNLFFYKILQQHQELDYELRLGIYKLLARRGVLLMQEESDYLHITFQDTTEYNLFLSSKEPLKIDEKYYASMKILGLDLGQPISKQEARTRFKQLIRMWHPDHYAEQKKEDAEAYLKKIIQAYDYVKDQIN